MTTVYEKTEDRIRRSLQLQNGMLDGPDPDYAKLPDVEYGDTVAIDWSGDLEGVTDYGYVFCWPDNEEDDANMGGVVHIPYPQNPGGKDRADAEWVTLYELGTNHLVKTVRRTDQWRSKERRQQLESALATAFVSMQATFDAGERQGLWLECLRLAKEIDRLEVKDGTDKV